MLKKTMKMAEIIFLFFHNYLLQITGNISLCLKSFLEILGLDGQNRCAIHKVMKYQQARRQ